MKIERQFEQEQSVNRIIEDDIDHMIVVGGMQSGSSITTSNIEEQKDDEKYIKPIASNNFKFFLIIGVMFLLILIVLVMPFINLNSQQNNPSTGKIDRPKLQQIDKPKQQKIINPYQQQVDHPQQQIDSPDTREQINRVPVFDFQTVIKAKKEQISKITNKQNELLCLSFDQRFHQFRSGQNNMYYQTNYQILMPSCSPTISPQSIQAWHKDRVGIQWAFYAVKKDDKILYYRPNINNLLEIIILSQIIGRDGQLFIADTPRSKCTNDVLALHQLPNNIKYLALSQLKSQQFDVIIANQTLFFEYNSNLKANTKLLIYSNNGLAQRQKLFKGFNVQSVFLEQGLCGGISFKKNTQIEGYYSLSATQLIRNSLKRTVLSSNLMKQLDRKYLIFKQEYKNRILEKLNLLSKFKNESICIEPRAKRTFSNFIVTIYGGRLYDAKLQQVLNWEKERQPIEWIRNIKQLKNINKNIYYEMKHSFNLLSIIEISSLLRENKILIFCDQSQCLRISRQVEALNLTNIQLINKTSQQKALLSQIIITDNEQLIKKVIENNYLQDTSNQLLGFFTSKRNESVTTLGKLYVNHHIKQITTPHANTECAGFEYLHYYWNSFNPNGYYQIKKGKYVIYAFWGGNIQNLAMRKKFIIKELMTQSVQVKIISSTSFYYFQTQDQPIHRAYPYLTPVHKSDYVRGYMMHNYGGGYTDIKHIHFDWKIYFQTFEKDQKHYVRGYAEKKYRDVACSDEDGLPSCHQVMSNYPRLAGNCFFIFKKKTPLSSHWFQSTKKTLDQKYELLEKKPYKYDRQRFGKNRFESGYYFYSEYPLRWAQIAGQKFSRAQYKYLKNVLNDMPYVITKDYIID